MTCEERSRATDRASAMNQRTAASQCTCPITQGTLLRMLLRFNAVREGVRGGRFPGARRRAPAASLLARQLAVPGPDLLSRRTGVCGP